MQELHRAIDEGAAGEGCLAAAAAAFPAVAEAAGAGRWATLKPVLQALVLSGDQQVIHGLARDLPRLARLLGPTRAASDWLPALEVRWQLQRAHSDSTTTKSKNSRDKRFPWSAVLRPALEQIQRSDWAAALGVFVQRTDPKREEHVRTGS